MLSAVALVGVGAIRHSKRAMAVMPALMAIAICIGLGATALFQLKLIGGVAWQLLRHQCFVTTRFTLLRAPLRRDEDRGDHLFLVFASDCFGYVVATSPCCTKTLARRLRSTARAPIARS